MNQLRLACLLGTGFEFFEFQIFAMLMPIWVEFFFSSQIPLNSRYFITYLLFGIAFVARLVGAIGLGFIGDQNGRKKALFYSMWIMAFSTGCIGLLPDYTQIGSIACLLLLLCRLGQGLSLGGEFSLGGVLLFEHHTKPNCINLIWQDLGGTGGLFVATLLISILNYLFTVQQMASFAWRLPFFTAFIISIWVIKLRNRIQHSAQHQQLIQINQQRSTKQYYQELKSYWRIMGLLTLCCAPNGVFWYLQIIYLPNQLISLSIYVILGLIALTWFTIPLGAILADQWGLYRSWSFSIVGLVVNFGTFILSHHKPLQILGLCIQALLLALNQGPRLLIMNMQFPLAIRALACSLVYSTANIMGGLAPFLSLWLLNKTHDNQCLLMVLIGLCSLALAAMIKMQRGSISASILI